MPKTDYKIAIFGLGYVGLPLALALAEKYTDVRGFDANPVRITELKSYHDRTEAADSKTLQSTKLKITSEIEAFKDIDIFIVAVPTPINANRQPDLLYVNAASTSIGKIMKRGAIIVYESTVYPGVTEGICGKILSDESGMICGKDFHLGYSPERINPGDQEHTIDKIVKVVSADDEQTLNILSEVYGSIVTVGVHRAPSIKVAEAAKVIENTQRDLNVAFMNELAMIFDEIGIRTKDVLEAAGTKWNFLKFTPGLVGGHCIGVDPYYLTSMAEAHGYHPQVILAGRRINDGMGSFVARKTIRLLVETGTHLKEAKVGILGITFKENVTDIRNSRVPDIITELREFGIEPLIYDPLADANETRKEYNVSLITADKLNDLDALILAVPHKAYMDTVKKSLTKYVRKGGVVVDIKSVLDANTCADFVYWSL